MGIRDLFKKKREDVVDLSDLQKRGIYNPKEEKEPQEVVDLSNSAGTEDVSALGFLGTMASSETGVGSDRKQRLKGVLRDIKSEIKHTGDKVYKLSDRLDLLEKKLDRIERRVGL